VSDVTGSFGLPVERDFVGMARGCVRGTEGAEADRDGTAPELLLRSRDGGGMEDNGDLSGEEFTKELLLLDVTELMLSSNAFTSGGTGI